MSTTLDALLAKTPGICGGRIRIDGTRITVHRLAMLYKQGQQPEEILQLYPDLTLSQVFTALAYFHANRDDIERELASDEADYEQLKQASSS